MGTIKHHHHFIQRACQKLIFAAIVVKFT